MKQWVRRRKTRKTRKHWHIWRSNIGLWPTPLFGFKLWN